MSWWLWPIIGYVVSYGCSLRMIVQRGWVGERDTFGCRRSPGVIVAVATVTAAFLAFVAPAVWLATMPDRDEARARKRAKVAELEAQEARAIAARNRALGIEP